MPVEEMENKINNIRYKASTEGLTKVDINCLITIYLRTSTNPYFIRDYNNFDNACFI